jgi:hypothetical protein
MPTAETLTPLLPNTLYSILKPTAKGFLVFVIVYYARCSLELFVSFGFTYLTSMPYREVFNVIISMIVLLETMTLYLQLKLSVWMGLLTKAP